MNDYELLQWVERESFYSLQRNILHLKDRMTTVRFNHLIDRLLHLYKMFPEAFPEPPLPERIELLMQQFRQELEDTDAKRSEPILE